MFPEIQPQKKKKKNLVIRYSEPIWAWSLYHKLFPKSRVWNSYVADHEISPTKG